MAYAVVQITAGIAGTLLAHAMFDLELLQWGTHSRAGLGQWIGEIVATFALVFTIIACVHHRPDAVPYAVGLVITAGLLVHVVNIFCQSGRHDRSDIYQQFRVNRRCRRTRLCWFAIADGRGNGPLCQMAFCALS